MTTPRKCRRSGFALIEALIALVLIAIGLLAVSKLQTMSLIGSGDGRARSEAANLSQQKIEELRNLLQRSDFTGLPTLPGSPITVPGSNATYTLAWTVTPDVNPDLDQLLVQVTTTWTDARGVDQRLDLNSLVAWDDPAAQVRLGIETNKNLISPTGEAQRGTGRQLTGLPLIRTNADGTKIYRDQGNTYLASANDAELLVLPADKNNNAQMFATITGRIYLHLTGQGQQRNPPIEPEKIQIRLSSEGECRYDPTDAAESTNIVTGTGGPNEYSFFTYTCYVGPGWYGNVGVSVVDVQGAGNEPTACVGDPGFSYESILASAHARGSALRTYRGFKPGATSDSLLSTGVAGGTAYGATYSVGSTLWSGAGLPKPSQLTSTYSPKPSGVLNYFNQHFLLVTKGTDCKASMLGSKPDNSDSEFRFNAGKYVCINPDAYTGAGSPCPPIWPNFENEVGTGGYTNVATTVKLSGGSSTNFPGSVIGSDGGINCGASWLATQVCTVSYASTASITLTALPKDGWTFVDWSNCPSASGNQCTVSTDTAHEVTANFTAGTNSTPYSLMVSKDGSGSGTITSSVGGIDCGNTCGANFASGDVTLTAAAANGSTFAGWGGACSGTNLTCVVSMSAARNVKASFTTGATCSTPTVINGSVQSSTGGIEADIGGNNACSLQAQSLGNYSCSFARTGNNHLAPGLWVTLTNAKTNGPTSGQFSAKLRVRTNCGNQESANFAAP